MKKYLNSVEEVVKALKEGGKVWDEECNSYFQILNDFITEFTKGDNNIITVNASIYFIEGKDRFYTEEAEPLKFEVNRAYITREGDKVFIFGKENDGFSVVGEFDTYDVNSNGKNITDGNSRLDIVGYWEEEK